MTESFSRGIPPSGGRAGGTGQREGTVGDAGCLFSYAVIF